MFRRGLVYSCRSYFLSLVVSPGPRSVLSGPCLFFFIVVVGGSFACRWGLFVSLTRLVRALSRSRFSAALAVLVSLMWRVRSGSMCDLRRPCSPWRPTCLSSRGSCYRVNWEVDRKVRTLRAFLYSDSGAASWRSGGDTVES